MQIKRVDVRNFRLLKDISLLLERRTTLIVGRNNSGKTSLTELFRRLLVDQRPIFRLEDFSLAAHEGFWDAAKLLKAGKEQKQVRDVVPVIIVKLTLTYEKGTQNLGALSECIIDLDPDCCEAVVELCFAPGDGKLTALLSEIGTEGETEQERKVSFFHVLKDRISSSYTLSLDAVDPNDPTNRKAIELSQLRSIVRGDLITAQRGLDDATNRDRDVLGKILQVLFETAVADSTDSNDKNTANQLKLAVEEIQRELNENVSQHVTDLLPTFKLFGYPGFSDPGLITETTFDVERLLQNHTKVRYTGVNGLTLPEAYNGLGARNLIFILLQLLSFFRTFKADPSAVGAHLVFIEEPEAHLHPQMQEVFISQIEKIADIFAKEMNGGVPWPVQFVVSTHSPHVANAVPFTRLRYFLAAPDQASAGLRKALVKDLHGGLSGEPEADRNFLHQYLTLTRYDLFFADKAILIEGTTERLLLPEMIKKVDAADASTPKLGSQYVTVMEVGGAYAHRFSKLLDFLELRALIITDIDPLNTEGSGCRVSEGVSTSNACIKDWFGDATVTPAALIAKPEADRVKGIRRLAYQIPETLGASCGRSFEDAFMLANKALFGLDTVPGNQLEEKAGALAKTKKKSTFALEHAIDKTDWTPPLYIAESLRWLAKDLLSWS